MLNNFAKVLLVSTSFAPVLATYAFVKWLREGYNIWSISLTLVFAGLTAVCFLMLKYAWDQGERIPLKVTAVRPADHEIVAFVIAYMLPLASLNPDPVYGPALVFVLAIFLLVIWTTNSYHVNPLLGVFGYHFYEVTTDTGVSFLLLTKRSLQKSRTTLQVVQLTNYIVLDKEAA